jgi:glycosyltransferase involved in cell wall biosynthesis
MEITLPKVSCVCPTFARAYLLEEAIESFHRQDYLGEKELIICNDFVDQELVYNHPEVKIINLSERAPNLGNKRNVAYSYASGDVFLTWGDDDIHLPGRISRMIEAMVKFNSEFVFEGPYYIIYAGKLSFEKGKTSGAHIVSKNLFYNAGQIPEINSGEDQAFNSKVKEYLAIDNSLPVCQLPPQFLYRWSSGRAHISQYGIDKENKKSGYELFLEQAKQYVKEGKEPGGRYELKPSWSKDWLEETKKVLT